MKGSRFLATAPIDELYDWFADETAATSPTWERLCRWIARTPEVNRRLDALPSQARQPNRLLAAVRFLDGPTEPGERFTAWLDERWPETERIVLTRTTQTNEPGRCAVLAPVLASLPQPITLLELGASAGLCLLPDRYTYGYDGVRASPDRANRRTRPFHHQTTRTPPGRGAPTFPCRTTGTPPGDPRELRVAARHGLDLNPLDPSDPDTRRWLRALIWPGEEDREERLAAALEIAAADPPPISPADLSDNPYSTIRAALDDLRRQAPSATPVISHSAFLAYLSRDDRRAVVDAIRHSGAHWVSLEGARVVPGIEADPPPTAPRNATFLLSLDGEPRGWAQAHGRSIHWIEGES